jgi:tRNA-2-methylthio-N6-dimethylallyladenosine synthase
VKKYHVTTFGCQMNEHDSERMKGMLESLGYQEALERDGSDLILFNTCSIRESADNRLIGNLGEAKRLKLEDPSRIVGVGGCWSQSLKDQVFEQFPFVDVAFGPGQIHKLGEFLQADDLEAQGYFDFEGFPGDLPMKRERPYQAWVQISQGCNCVCAYCIVPSTRGRERSRDPQAIVVEVEHLAANGVKEVTLLGQNVNSYGRDLPKESRIDFADLLGLVDGIDGIERIRYTSPHPKDVREKLVQAHAELPSLCEHIHLPLQSGSSRVLKAMRRTYDRERYLKRVEMIREHVPDCAITTDIIVGFPGETEADFAETLEVVDEVGYDSAFTFIFSPRRETEAALLPDQPTRCRTPSSRSGSRGSSSSSSKEHWSAAGGSSERRRRSWWRVRAAPTPRSCEAARVTTRRSTSPVWRSRGTSSTSRSPPRHRRRWQERNPSSPTSAGEPGRDLRADSGRQDRDRNRVGRPSLAAGREGCRRLG